MPQLFVQLNRISSPSDPQKNSKKSHQCPNCHRLFNWKWSLERHIQRNCEKRKYFFCNICNYASNFKRNLAQHVQRVHITAKKLTAKRKNGSKVYSHRCQKCDKVFSKNHTLVKHMKIKHGKSQKFNCKFCNYFSYYKVNLERHTFNRHNSEKRVQCQICKKKYKSPYSLYSHRRYFCGDGSFLSCDHCSYTTKAKGNLIRHMSTIHELTRLLYECQNCNKAYSSKASFSNHLRLRCNKIRKCSFCDQEIPDGLTYRDHYLTCPNRHILYCDYCDYSTKYKSVLSRHISTYHNIDETAVEFHECLKCRKTYKSKAALNRHLNLECNKEPCFFCKKCNYSTKFKHNLARHVKIKHP